MGRLYRGGFGLCVAVAWSSGAWMAPASPQEWVYGVSRQFTHTDPGRCVLILAAVGLLESSRPWVGSTGMVLVFAWRWRGRGVHGRARRAVDCSMRTRQLSRGGVGGLAGPSGAMDGACEPPGMGLRRVPPIHPHRSRPVRADTRGLLACWRAADHGSALPGAQPTMGRLYRACSRPWVGFTGRAADRGSAVPGADSAVQAFDLDQQFGAADLGVQHHEGRRARQRGHLRGYRRHVLGAAHVNLQYRPGPQRR